MGGRFTLVEIVIALCRAVAEVAHAAGHDAEEFAVTRSQRAE